MRTPAREDKRLHLTGAACALLFLFLWLGKATDAVAVPAVVALVGGYMAQSQWGQTTRSKAALNAPPPA